METNKRLKTRIFFVNNQTIVLSQMHHHSKCFKLFIDGNYKGLLELNQGKYASIEKLNITVEMLESINQKHLENSK